MNNVYMREEMRELWKLFEYSRWYPNIGIEHILGVNLPIHQQSMAREIWYHQDIVNLSSRRCGKTFVSGGVIPMLLCILFDNFKVGIVSPNFRTSGVAFGEAEKIYENSALVRALCKREPVHGSGSYRIEFKNGSVIEAAPLGSQGDGLRGKGYHYIFCDEYAYLSNGESILNNVLLPMLFTKRTISDNVHPMGSFNRMVISST
ncbi:MAG: terminase large subunit domain-containing protein, partial [bacterium]